MSKETYKSKMRPRRETYWHSRKPERQGETLGLERLWIGALGGMACMYTCYTHVTRMLMACMYTCYTHVTPMWMACMYTSYTQVHRVHILQCTTHIYVLYTVICVQCTRHITHMLGPGTHITHMTCIYQFTKWIWYMCSYIRVYACLVCMCMRVWYVCVRNYCLYAYALIVIEFALWIKWFVCKWCVCTKCHTYVCINKYDTCVIMHVYMRFSYIYVCTRVVLKRCCGWSDLHVHRCCGWSDLDVHSLYTHMYL